MQESFSKVLASHNPMDTYILARYFYSIGQEVLADSQYDKLHRAIKQNFPNNEYVNRTYDDDPVPISLLQKYGFSLPPDSPQQTSDHIDNLIKTEQSKSIQPIETMEDALSWFNGKEDLEFIFSLKVDGINTKNLYHKISHNTWKLTRSVTRGRKGEPFDISENMGKVIPQTFTSDNAELPDDIFIRGEVYVEGNKLEELRNYYNAEDGLKTPRSAAISFIRVKHEPQHYKHCHCKVFKISHGATTSSSIDIARSLGFETVPYTVHTKCPKDLSVRRRWLEIITKGFSLYAHKHNIPADGVVCEVNDTGKFYTLGEKNQYFGGNIALKINEFGSNVYTSTITDLELKQQGERFSCVAIIEPVTVKSGVTVSRVNVFNLDIMIRNNILPNNPITFEYKSESSVNLIYK